jgi:hypothetical protein
MAASPNQCDERQLGRASGRVRADLPQKPDVISAGPVLDDHAVDNPPDVDVRPRDRTTRDFGASKQPHARSPVAPVDRHVVDDEVAFGDEVVMIDGDLVPEILDDRSEDLFPTLSTLRTPQVVFPTRRVVH